MMDAWLKALLALGVVAAAHPVSARDEVQGVDKTRRIAPLPLDKLSSRPPQSVTKLPPFVLHEQAQPGEAKALTLDEVRRAVLENQLEVRVELITPQQHAEIVKEEEARFNAVFSAGAVRLRSEAFTNVVTRSDNYVLATSIPLRTGGSLRLALGLDKQETPSLVATSDLALTFSQPLARNAGVRVNTAAIESAKLSAEQAVARAKLMVINYLGNADRAYWRYWLSWRELDIRYEQYRLAGTQVTYAQETVKAGLIAQVDIIRSQSGVARRLEDILLAEASRRQTERELKRIMNRADLPLVGALALKPADEPQLQEISLLPERVLAQAIENRMDLLSAQLQTAIDAIDNEVAKNQLLPLFSFNLGYTIKGVGTGMDALQGLRDKRYPDSSVGFSLEMPFDNSGARAKARRVALQQASGLETLAMRKRQIEKDVLDTVDQLHQSWQRILAADYEIGTANDIYNAELEQFRHGMRTSTDVLNAAQLIADAKIRSARAIVDYELAKVDLAYATGTTLGYAGVEITPYQLRGEGLPNR